MSDYFKLLFYFFNLFNLAIFSVNIFLVYLLICTNLKVICTFSFSLESEFCLLSILSNFLFELLILCIYNLISAGAVYKEILNYYYKNITITNV